MKRTKISAPVKWLVLNGLVTGRTLDFGCGHGFDADQFGFDKWDPNFHPDWPKGEYDTILCNYVLNVIEPDRRKWVIDQIRGFLAKDGIAYFTVRRDIKGTTETSRGTTQYRVNPRMDFVHNGGHFGIYRLQK